MSSSPGKTAAVRATFSLPANTLLDSLPPSAAQVATVFTPINLLLLSLLLLTAYLRLRPTSPTTLPKPASPILFRTFTPPTLRPYDGTASKPVYLSIRGRVFDVTSGRNFYGPEGPYANFAGRDASRGLACGSFDEDMLTKDLEGPLDSLQGLGDEEMEGLRGWEERFLEKYLVVGRLVSCEEKKREDAEGKVGN